ncbi:hypothetical protein [Massiliimalia massiliensis]|uniref:hypothetical protein n=1 Tax=Massiliimalia massiliensis TaxID=1852384 RepID=UPI00117B4479|nr:hypothetical protein [Massiliimalia massiliensis]
MYQYPQKLTKSESDFAERHYDVIHDYLVSNRLPEEEYYDVVIFAFLSSVQIHFRQEELRQYPFIKLAKRSMDTACVEHILSKRNEKRHENLFSQYDSSLFYDSMEDLIPDFVEFFNPDLMFQSGEENLIELEDTDQILIQCIETNPIDEDEVNFLYAHLPHSVKTAFDEQSAMEGLSWNIA